MARLAFLVDIGGVQMSREDKRTIIDRILRKYTKSTEAPAEKLNVSESGVLYVDAEKLMKSNATKVILAKAATVKFDN